MAKLIYNRKQNNQILYVVIELTTEQEKKIYKSFMATEPILDQPCEKCGEKFDKEKIKDYYIMVSSPASADLLGFPTGVPVIKCPHCGHSIKMSMMDITPFPAIVNWKKQFRAKALKEKR